jgi:SAM-dependent methyltransferase
VTSDTRDNWDLHWAEYAKSAQQNPGQEYRRRVIFSLLGLRDSGTDVRLLDIGSGQGDMAAAVRAKFPSTEILGLELSQSGVEISRQKVPNARFVQRNLLDKGTPPEDQRGWATHAVCSEVIEHVDDPCELLRSARQYMSCGCKLVVTAPGGPISAFDKHIGHRQHFSKPEIHELLRKAGYEVERVTGAGFPFFNLYRCVVVLRGKKLMEDVSARNGQPASLLARMVMAGFGFLCRLNLDSLSWGWQLVAKAVVPSEGNRVICE